MTLKTLADVHKLFSHLPAEARRKSAWQYVSECLKGGDARAVSVALRIAVLIDRVPFHTPIV
jgi:hypothetical protein